MATNKKITDLTSSIPSGGFNLITATGTSNYRVTYSDVAEYSSIGTKTGSFTDYLSVSGAHVVPAEPLQDGEVVYYSGQQLRGDQNRIFINSVGVGINTSTPTYTLEVNGNVNIAGTLYTGGSVVDVISQQLSISGSKITLNSGEVGAGVTDNTAGILIDRGSLSSGYFLFTESSQTFSPSHDLVITGNKYLGIGTDNPVTDLHIYKAGSTLIPKFEGTTNEVGLNFDNDQSNWSLFLDDSAYDELPYGGIGFHGGTSPTLKFAIDDSGRAAISSGALSTVAAVPLSSTNLLSVSGESYLEALYVTGVDGSWGQVTTGGGGGGTPGGSDTQVQFNQSSAFGGSSYLIYDYGANFLSGASGIFDYVSGNTGHFKNEAIVGTGDTLLKASGNYVEISGNLRISGSGGATAYNSTSGAVIYATGGKLLAPSGEFTESLTISGVSVCTGCSSSSSAGGVTEAFVMFTR